MASRERIGTVIVIGIGNRYRSDDAAGLEAARRVALLAPDDVDVLELEGEPTSLLDAWGDAETVYLVDAVSSGGAPGAVYRFDARIGPAPAQFTHRGTHAFSVADVVELARALDRLPTSLIAYGIEGGGFGAGVGLSPEVERGVRDAVEGLVSELSEGSPLMCLGTVGTVTKVWDDGGVPMALVDGGRTTDAACLLAHPEVTPGTSVLVHMGFVVDVLDEGSADEARRLRAGATRREEPR